MKGMSSIALIEIDRSTCTSHHLRWRSTVLTILAGRGSPLGLSPRDRTRHSFSELYVCKNPEDVKSVNDTTVATPLPRNAGQGPSSAHRATRRHRRIPRWRSIGLS